MPSKESLAMISRKQHGRRERTHPWDHIDPSFIGCVTLSKLLHLSELMVNGNNNTA